MIEAAIAAAALLSMFMICSTIVALSAIFKKPEQPARQP